MNIKVVMVFLLFHVIYHWQFHSKIIAMLIVLVYSFQLLIYNCSGICLVKEKINNDISPKHYLVRQIYQSWLKSQTYCDVTVDLEADISQLEAPTFTTLNRGPPEPMLRLKWDHRVNLVAEKVLNPMIHCCDKCLKPILIYGRMVC